jgi:PIN domain nuclease of toxin-antitoxin system
LRLLLDTHALVWSASPADVHRLSRPAREAVESRSNEVLVSAASAWEVATKHRLGRLPAGERLVQNWTAILSELRAFDLAVTSGHGRMAGGFTVEHGDPFDRMLAAQAIIEGAWLVTADPAMQAFGADLLW